MRSKSRIVSRFSVADMPAVGCAPTLRRWYVEASATVAVRMLTLRAPINLSGAMAMETVGTGL